VAPTLLWLRGPATTALPPPATATRLEFIWDNLPTMAEVMCIVGHIVDNLKSFSIDECVLVHPTEFISEGVFQSVTKQPADSRLSRWLGSLEGSYLHYGPDKKRSVSEAGERWVWGRMHVLVVAEIHMRIILGQVSRCESINSTESIHGGLGCQILDWYWGHRRMFSKPSNVLWNGIR
jgi:hypothetical protein